MKKAIIKTFSLIISAAILLSMPMNAFAEEAAETETVSETVDVTDTSADANQSAGLPDTSEIHGIYVSAFVASTKSMMDEIIANIDETSINAVVIDVKNDDGNVVFDMDSELIDELGVENILVKDMPGLLNELHNHGIYVIARCVAFRDPFIDEVKPDWVIHSASGEIYEDAKGFTWMDPTNEEVKAYLIEVAKGCKKVGFDEVQYDYVRYGTGIQEEDIKLNGYGRRHSILKFVKEASASLKKENIPLSLDVFGTIINSKVDRDIVGQEYSQLSMYADYLSPMIYPSHYYDNTLGLDHPDLYPYEAIDTAMKLSDAELKVVNPKGTRTQASVRPWLQGFTASYLKHYKSYGAAEIKAQIKAVNDNGITSWIIWNPSCKYPWEAFK